MIETNFYLNRLEADNIKNVCILMKVQKDVKFCYGLQSKTLHAKKAFFVKLPEKISQQDRKETFITAELGNPRQYWRQAKYGT